MTPSASQAHELSPNRRPESVAPPTRLPEAARFFSAVASFDRSSLSSTAANHAAQAFCTALDVFTGRPLEYMPSLMTFLTTANNIPLCSRRLPASSLSLFCRRFVPRTTLRKSDSSAKWRLPARRGVGESERSFDSSEEKEGR